MREDEIVIIFLPIRYDYKGMNILYNILTKCAILAAYEDHMAIVSDNEVSTLQKGWAMQLQRRSNAYIVKIVVLIAMLAAVFAAISALLYISPRGVPLPTIDLPKNTWCAIALASIMAIALLGLGINAKRRDDNR